MHYHSKMAYFITITKDHWIATDTLTEALVTVGRFLERLSHEEGMRGKYLFVQQRALADDGTYVEQEGMYEESFEIP